MRVHRSLSAGLALGFLLACGGGSSSSTPQTQGGLSGSKAVTFRTSSGVVPEASPAALISAFVPTPSGGYLSYPGTLSGTSFTIPGVSSGGCWVRSQLTPSATATHVWVTGSGVDMGTEVVGREDAVAAGAGSLLTLNASPVSPWASTDRLVLYAPNLGYAMLVPLGISPGSTAITNVSIAMSGRGLSVQGKGDQLLIGQLATHTAPGGELYQVLDEAWQPAAFTQTDGASTPLTGAFSAPTSGSAWRLRWSRSAFEQYRSAIQSDAPFSPQQNALLLSAPFGSTDPLERAPLTLVNRTVSGATGVDEDLGDIAYPNGLGGTPLGNFSITQLKSFTLPGTLGASPFIRLQIAVYVPADAGTSASVQPMVSPVTGLQLNGQDIFGSPQTDVGLSPLLSWSLPTLGAPHFYVVTLYHLTVDGANRTALTLVASFTTPQREVRVPGDLLVAGQTYFAVVSANVAPNMSLNAPFRRNLPLGIASCVTQTFIP